MPHKTKFFHAAFLSIFLFRSPAPLSVRVSNGKRKLNCGMSYINLSFAPLSSRRLSRVFRTTHSVRRFLHAVFRAYSARRIPYAAFFTPPFARIPHDAFRTPLSSRRFPHAVRATSENLNDGILSMSLFARLRRFSRSEFLAPLSSRCFSCAVCDYRKRRTSFAMSLYYNCFYYPVSAKLLPRTITPR